MISNFGRMSRFHGGDFTGIRFWYMICQNAAENREPGIMIISYNWLKDFVDIPTGLDPRELALQFTTTTAEVEDVEHVEPNFSGLVAARIESVRQQAGEDKLKTVIVDAGKRYTTLSTAPDIVAGSLVMYAPPGATVGGHTVGTTDPQGRAAEGMIVAGQGIGLVQVGANAMFLPPSYRPSQSIDAAPFDDWLIEIDNKSITHRPDCWGHYGIAREVAAILKRPLKPYDVTPTSDLQNGLPAIPIEIDDPALCPRYSGLLMKGLKAQPAPLWMQVRLALCGQRPIDLLVDLTNYIMLELGQPMHAFDGERLPNIEVATAEPGETFTTLDGVTRTMPDHTLMIQCNRKSVAIAGVMGGAETEVSEGTSTVLLESANFDAPTVRRAATAMGHRTEASSRFEKSLDPENTIAGIARFHRLAAHELPDLQLASTLSDCHPSPRVPHPIELDCDFTSRFIGKAVTPEEIIEILERLEFKCERRGAMLRVTPPSYRATKDIEIEADLIEEVARFIGYNAIEPALPRVSARHLEESPALVLEERTLDYFCVGNEFVEVHDYIWYDDDWVKTIGFDPGECIVLQNPAAENCPRLRRTLIPGLIAFAERNRHHLPKFQLAEIGSVFEPGHDEVTQSQHRRLGLVVAQQGRKADAEVWKRLQRILDGWSQQVLERPLQYQATQATQPWEDAGRIAEAVVAERRIGRVTILPLAIKQKIDERLKSWSIAVAELSLTAVTDLIGHHEKLPTVSKHPQAELDFSILIDASRRYADTRKELAAFEHPLQRRVSFIDSYEGGSIPAGKRSLTLRALIGLDDRTLTDEEIQDFQATFKRFLKSHDMELRGE
ncbi:MAG: phenylalanine--tRNA ligase subunit beta [Phycisphaerales bacterium]|nr:phenylalanine--tRNA ligase subunit beta [Phycisphaerales bacterium]